MSTPTTKTPRITKAMKFDGLEAALNGAALPHGLTVADLLAFCEAEKALLAKKNTAERKPTEKQKENERFKALILDFLATCENGATCTDIGKGIPELSAFGSQKTAALLKPLMEAGKVSKTVVKGRAMFSLA